MADSISTWPDSALADYLVVERFRCMGGVSDSMSITADAEWGRLEV